jgi:hypothetical protein
MDKNTEKLISSQYQFIGMGHFEDCSFKPKIPEGCDLKKSRILLHCCCAPCSTAILEWMVEEGLRPGVFFSNSNIVPFEEYVKRRDELARYAATFGLEAIDDEYDHAAWLEYVRRRVKSEVEGPERGPRCQACFEFRLLRAARYAITHGYDILTTTLASSRWKDLNQVNAAGLLAVLEVGSSLRAEKETYSSTKVTKSPRCAENRPFSSTEADKKTSRVEKEAFPSTGLQQEPLLVWWPQNWRKGGLQERRSFLIKSCALYNQTWCGCEFSQKII